MVDPYSEDSELGVYCMSGKGAWLLVHRYEEDDYGLEDIPGRFGLGQTGSSQDDACMVLELSLEQLKQLKVLIDAQSFDHEAGFVEMCLDMYRFGVNDSRGDFRFVANF